jgi:PadR family transcriptional regulator, regulatory protein PadR
MSRTAKLFNKNTGEEKKKMSRSLNSQKEVSTKLTKGLLDLIILQLVNTQPMHGYEIITKIRKNFGVYFGPSTVYPLLNTLEKKDFVKSEWNMNTERPRKVYSLTNNGQNMLNFTEESLNMICRKLTVQTKTEINMERSTPSAVVIIPESARKKDIHTQANRLPYQIH